MNGTHQKTDKSEPLKRIWQQIPKAVTEQIDLSQKEIINRYMDAVKNIDGFYIIFNTQTATAEFISSEMPKVLGYLPEEFTLDLVMNNIHPEDLSYYYHYEASAVRFFSELPPELFFSYQFSYDYRIRTSKGSYKRLRQQIIPVYYFPDGGARTLGIFTDIDHLDLKGSPKLSFIGMEGAPSYYNVHLDKKFSPAENLLSSDESEILAFIMKGMENKAISATLNQSVRMINERRRNILLKSGCKTESDLIIKAVREGWI